MTPDAPILEPEIRLDRTSRSYVPGELLVGSFRVPEWRVLGVRACELSVLWYTVGKGEEDLAVTFFRRTSLEGAQEVDLTRPQPFDTRLPASPLSYDGVLVKIRWCVRLRLFFTRGREHLQDLGFQLGEVDPVTLLDKDEAEKVETA